MTDIAEPIFAEVATAMQYGIGGTSSLSVTTSTMGVKIRQIVSFTKNAARIPVANTSSTSNWNRVRAIAATCTAIQSKNPEI